MRRVLVPAVMALLVVVTAPAPAPAADRPLRAALRTAQAQVNLSPPVLREGNRLAWHSTLHELGHGIDGVLGEDESRNDLFAALARSPRRVPCWPMPLGSSSRCVRSNEVLADQFAFWATGGR